MVFGARHSLYVYFSCFHSFKWLQLCPNLCVPMDFSLPGSSVHGILQARILEWVAMPSSRGSSWPRDRTHVSMSPALAGEFFTTSATWEAPYVFIKGGNWDTEADMCKGRTIWRDTRRRWPWANWGERPFGLFLHSLRRNQPWRHLDFGFLASRIVRP